MPTPYKVARQLEPPCRPIQIVVMRVAERGDLNDADELWAVEEVAAGPPDCSFHPRDLD